MKIIVTGMRKLEDKEKNFMRESLVKLIFRNGFGIVDVKFLEEKDD